MRAILATLAVMGVSLSGAVVPADGALAAGTCSVSVAPRLVVDQPLERFPAALRSDCAAAGMEWSAWDVAHTTYGPVTDLYFDGTTTDTWDHRDHWRPGTYAVTPGWAADASGGRITQNTLQVSVRYGSRLGVTTARSGEYVTVTGNLRRYDPGRDVFVPWGGQPVALQVRTCATCAWTTLTTLTSSTTGLVSHRVRAASPRYYRATTAHTAAVWGSASARSYR